jgi:predicted nucleic acid-binding protein
VIVLDASLAVKLVVQEADSDLADRWFAGVQDEVIAPDLLAIEVAQAIVRRENARDMPQGSGRDTLRAWRAILDGGAIALIRTQPAHVEAAAELALALGHPVKDCIYLALAADKRGELATCDAKFAVKARTIHPAVKLLRDY